MTSQNRMLFGVLDVLASSVLAKLKDPLFRDQLAPHCFEDFALFLDSRSSSHHQNAHVRKSEKVPMYGWTDDVVAAALTDEASCSSMSVIPAETLALKVQLAIYGTSKQMRR